PLRLLLLLLRVSQLHTLTLFPYTTLFRSGRDSVQLTIYNSADLTLVKETRFLTLRKGLNKLEFSWANTLIDPTSVEFRALTHAEDRKSTRLKSSHQIISYAVFCLKKKTNS